jgi:hypothetical protein
MVVHIIRDVVLSPPAEILELDLNQQCGPIWRCFMPIWICHVCDHLLAFWLTATPTDFGRVAVLVVLLGWIFSRRYR